MFKKMLPDTTYKLFGRCLEEIEYFLSNSMLPTNQEIIVSKSSFFCHHDGTL